MSPDGIVPCLILNVTEEEADKILAPHDPLAVMATVNSRMLGDMWLPGDHRLLCGDSINRDDVAPIIPDVGSARFATSPRTPERPRNGDEREFDDRLISGGIRRVVLKKHKSRSSQASTAWRSDALNSRTMEELNQRTNGPEYAR